LKTARFYVTSMFYIFIYIREAEPFSSSLKLSNARTFTLSRSLWFLLGSQGEQRDWRNSLKLVGNCIIVFRRPKGFEETI